MGRHFGGKILNNIGSKGRDKQMGARQTRGLCAAEGNSAGAAQASDDGLIPRLYKKLLKT